MLKYWIGAVLLLSSWAEARAQPFVWYTLYRENHGQINPASVHADYYLSDEHYNTELGASFRQSGLSRAVAEVPQTKYFRGAYIFDRKPLNRGIKIQLGGQAMIDRFGPTEFQDFGLRVGGILQTDRWLFSLGLNYGRAIFQIDSKTFDPNMTGDPVLGQSLRQSFAHFDGGVFGKVRLRRYNELYAGFSVRYQGGIDFYRPSTDGRFPLNGQRRYAVTFGSYHFLNDRDFVEPSLWIKMQDGPEPTHVDLNLRYQFYIKDRNAFWVGAGLGQMNDKERVTFHLEMGLQLPPLSNWKPEKTLMKLGLGYDHFLSSLSGAIDQAFELHASFFLGRKPK